MTQIWERLFIGCLADAERLARKNPNGIAAVISLCEQCVEDKAANIRYVCLPIEDDEPVPVRQFNAVINALAVNISQGVVLLHCGLGISRAPTLAAAYLHRTGYKNFDAAIEEIRQFRPNIEPSQILMTSVKENL
jgi:protein-tyrosine phosphatase